MTAIILEGRTPEEATPIPVLPPPPIRSITLLQPEPPDVSLGDRTDESSAPSSSTAITDFSRSAHEVAEQIARGNESSHFRSLARQTQATLEKKREPSIFAAPEHAPHTTEHFDDGSDRYYVSGNCFYDFDRTPPPASDLMAGPKLKVATCKPPPESGNQDMFKELRPEFLKKLPGDDKP